MAADLGVHDELATPDGGAAPARPLTEPAPGAAERRLLWTAVRTLALLAPIVAGIAWWSVGPAGAASAIIGLGFVLLLFGASAALLVYLAARDAGAGIGVLAGGAVLRLPLYVVILMGLSTVPWIHGRSLAAATAVAIAVTLAAELRMLANTPRLFWVDATAARPSALENDTRS